MDKYKYCIVNYYKAYLSSIPMTENEWLDELKKRDISTKNLKFSNTLPYMVKLIQLKYSPEKEEE